MRKVFKDPVILKHSINDAEELARQSNDGLAGAAPGFHPLIEISQIRAVLNSDQRGLDQSCSADFAAALMNAAGMLGFIRVGHARHDAKVRRQAALVRKVADIADHA